MSRTSYLQNAWKKGRFYLIAACFLTLGIIIRILFLKEESNDYLVFQPYYALIKAQGTKAFATPHLSIYPPFYLYLLYIEVKLFPLINDVLAIKLPSILADILLATAIAGLIQIKYQRKTMSLVAGIVVFFLPTVILNSAYWGQLDSIYTCLIIASIYFIFNEKPFWAMVLMGMAFSIKLQTVFIFPALLVLLLHRQIAFRYFLLIPLVYFVSVIPSWIAGRSLWELLTIYLYQTGAAARLTMHAPNLYAFLPEEMFQQFYIPGILWGAGMTLLFIWLGSRGKQKLDGDGLLLLFLISLVLVPLVFPKMHERYFYPAEVLAVAWAFYRPRYFYIPVLLEWIAFFAYQPFLFHVDVLDLRILAGAMFITFLLLISQGYQEGLFTGPAENPAELKTLPRKQDSN